MDIRKLLSVNRDVFLVVVDNALVVWNYKSGRRHAINLDAIRALIDTEFRRTHVDIVKMLLQANILTSDTQESSAKWGWDVLSRIFHVGTTVRRRNSTKKTPAELSRAYIEYCTSIFHEMPVDAFSTTRGVGDIELVPSHPERLSNLLNIFDRRISSRTFSGESMSFADVSLILDESFRYREHDMAAFKRMGMFTATSRRSTPSAGSLQSCEAYLIARNVSTLQKGVYHYRSHLRNMGLVRPLGDEFSFGDLLCGQMFADDLSAAIVISCRFDKLMWKYKQSRAYRAALLDAGHLSQTIQLIATALGIRTWPTAAFYDDELGALLELSEDFNEAALLVVGLGTGEVNPFDRDLGTGFANPDND